MIFVSIFSLIDGNTIAVPAYVIQGNQNFATWTGDRWVSNFAGRELIYLPHAFRVV